MIASGTSTHRELLLVSDLKNVTRKPAVLTHNGVLQDKANKNIHIVQYYIYLCMCNTVTCHYTSGVYLVDHPITSWQYRLCYYSGDKTSGRIKRLECRNSVSLFIKCVRIVRPTLSVVCTPSGCRRCRRSIRRPTDRHTYTCVLIRTQARSQNFFFFFKHIVFTWCRSHVMLFFVGNARDKHDPNIFFVFICYFKYCICYYIICSPVAVLEVRLVRRRLT